MGVKFMAEIAKLTDLELVLMKVMWERDTSLTIQEIAAYLDEKEMSIPSITQAIKHLISKKAVTVNSHVLVSNVYARTFTPCFSREEYVAAELKRLQNGVFGNKKVNTAGIFAALLNNDNNESISLDEAEELERMINDKKRELKNGEE